MKKAFALILSVILICTLAGNAFAKNYITLGPDWEKQFISDSTKDFRTTGDYKYEYEISYCELGDIDNDWKITASDARLALRLSVKLEDGLSAPQLKAADVDFDGSVTAADARIILRTSVRLEILTNDGITSDRKAPPVMNLTQADVEELKYIGCEYIKWLGIPVDKEFATGYTCENFGGFIDDPEFWSRYYLYYDIYEGSVLTPKEILKNDMLGSIYNTYYGSITETGNVLWGMYPIFRDNGDGSFSYMTGYALSFIPFKGELKNAPYNYPYNYVR